MKADAEFALIHDGRQWSAGNNDLSVSGNTLGELENNLQTALRDSGMFQKGKKITVFIGYDPKAIPAWIRPYQSHYFNRRLTFQL
jgi:hypothetical protein